jgi:hypothetical protein
MSRGNYMVNPPPKAEEKFPNPLPLSSLLPAAAERWGRAASACKR